MFASSGQAAMQALLLKTDINALTSKRSKDTILIVGDPYAALGSLPQPQKFCAKIVQSIVDGCMDVIDERARFATKERRVTPSGLSSCSPRCIVSSSLPHSVAASASSPLVYLANNSSLEIIDTQYAASSLDPIQTLSLSSYPSISKQLIPPPFVTETSDGERTLIAASSGGSSTSFNLYLVLPQSDVPLFHRHITTVRPPSSSAHASIQSLHFSRDGSHISASLTDGTVHIYALTQYLSASLFDPKTGGIDESRLPASPAASDSTPILSVPCPFSSSALAIQPTAHFLTSFANHLMTSLQTSRQTSSVAITYPGHSNVLYRHELTGSRGTRSWTLPAVVTCCAADQDGGQLLIGLQDGSCCLMDMNLGITRTTFREHAVGPVHEVHFWTPKFALSASAIESKVLVYDLSTFKLHKSIAFDVPPSAQRRISVRLCSPFAIVLLPTTTIVVDILSGEPIARISPHSPQLRINDSVASHLFSVTNDCILAVEESDSARLMAIEASSPSSPSSSSSSSSSPSKPKNISRLCMWTLADCICAAYPPLADMRQRLNSSDSIIFTIASKLRHADRSNNSLVELSSIGLGFSSHPGAGGGGSSVASGQSSKLSSRSKLLAAARTSKMASEKREFTNASIAHSQMRSAIHGGGSSPPHSRPGTGGSPSRGATPASSSLDIYANQLIHNSTGYDRVSGLMHTRYGDHVRKDRAKALATFNSDMMADMKLNNSGPRRR